MVKEKLYSTYEIKSETTYDKLNNVKRNEKSKTNKATNESIKDIQNYIVKDLRNSDDDKKDIDIHLWIYNVYLDGYGKEPSLQTNNYLSYLMFRLKNWGSVWRVIKKFK